jgi:secretion/DNA translocation related TadE-like protein
MTEQISFEAKLPASSDRRNAQHDGSASRDGSTRTGVRDESNDAQKASARDDRGSGTVLMMAVMLITAMVAVAGAILIAWFSGVHHARSAADLAALAGAQAYSTGHDACDAARSTATNNKATLTACSVDTNGYDFVVRVFVEVPVSPLLPGGPTKFRQESYAGNVPS